MIPPFWERVKQWICRHFGHRLKFSHNYNGKHYVCTRCRHYVSKGVHEY